MHLKNQKWLECPNLIQLMNILNKEGLNARIVGGSVRDALMGCAEIGDVDIASRLTPAENIALLNAAIIKVIPTGIDHGTITAVLNQNTFEITTLRRDVKTDGRHAEVEFTDDWTEDALRRDFTINAFYLDMDGSVHDPLGGKNDLKNHSVRFIGDPVLRIKEDALRILRFYRFYGEIGLGDIDAKGHEAAQSLQHMIKDLSGERKWQELKKILLSDRADEVLKIMSEGGIFSEILVENEIFSHFINVEKALGIKDAIGRLSCLLPRKKTAALETAKELRLSNKEADLLKRYTADFIGLGLDEKSLRHDIYRYGKDVLIHNLCRKRTLTRVALNFIQNSDIPKFPIHGKDLINQGWEPGTDLGKELKRLEALWIENDFKPLV